jgi:phosphate transport system protein
VVSSAVRSATTALLEADIHLAEQVISDDERIDAKQAEIEGRAFCYSPPGPGRR